MIADVFALLGSEELRLLSGLMAPAVRLASPCLAEWFWSRLTVLTLIPGPSPAPHHPRTSPLLMEKVQLEW